MDRKLYFLFSISHFYKFAAFDALAAVCNISALFWLVYFLGKRGGLVMKVIGVIVLLIFIGVSIYIMRSKKILMAPRKKNDGVR